MQKPDTRRPGARCARFEEGAGARLGVEAAKQHTLVVELVRAH